MTLQDTLAAFTRHLHRKAMRPHLRFAVVNATNDNLRSRLSLRDGAKGAGIPSLPAPTLSDAVSHDGAHRGFCV